MLTRIKTTSKDWLLRAKNNRLFISTLSVSIFVILWEVLPRAGLVDVSYISQPTRVLAAAFEEMFVEGVFWGHLYVSFIELAVGFILSLLVGIPLGLMIGLFRKARYFLDPPLMALWSTPRLALIPIFIIWLGVGVESKIAVVFVGSFIPIIVNTVAGIRDADISVIQAARSFCAKKRDIVIRILLPTSLPSMMTGIRLGLGRAMMGMVVGEMYVSTKGLGYQIMQYGEAYRMDQVIFYVAFVSLSGFAITNSARNLENRLLKWKEG